MRGVWTAEQVRAAEQQLFATVPESTVMRRAAYGVAGATARLLAEQAGAVAGQRVALLVGAGNNGGDALWAGAFLRRRGVAVTAVLLAPERAHAAGLAALHRAGGRRIDAEHRDDAVRALRRADVVIDGIVGLSASGPLRPLAADLVAEITAPIVAVDLPSGVDPGTGAVTGPAVHADVTVTFGGRRPAHVLGEGALRSGRVQVVDIGIGGDLAIGGGSPMTLGRLGEPDLIVLDHQDIGAFWPVPGPEDDKYSQGVVGVAAGSAVYPGAAVLAAGSAVLATSGMVRYAGEAADPVRSRWPEVVATGSVTDAGRVQAWVVGPGLGTGSAGRSVLAQVLRAGVPVCADADAITLLAQEPNLWDERDPDTPLVLTPHAGEFARLFGAIGDDRVAAVRRAAARVNAVVLLKGHTTVIAEPGGRVLVNPAHTAWLATAGSGDVLSGLLGALLATGMDPQLAAGSAAGVHELAGQLAAAGTPASAALATAGDDQVPGAPAPASRLVEAIPAAIRLVRRAALS